MPELIIFVGLPGSGKTTCYQRHFAATHLQVSFEIPVKTALARNRTREGKARVPVITTEGL